MVAAATAMPMPLGHTVELNAGTLDTDVGPHLHANWTWASSALDDEQVEAAEPVVVRRSIGHLRSRARGGGGLTPSDIAPARISQQQIDEIARQRPDR